MKVESEFLLKLSCDVANFSVEISWNDRTHTLINSLSTYQIFQKTFSYYFYVAAELKSRNDRELFFYNFYLFIFIKLFLKFLHQFLKRWSLIVLWIQVVLQNGNFRLTLFNHWLEFACQVLIFKANRELLSLSRATLGIVHANPTESLRWVFHRRHVDVRSDELIEDKLENLLATKDETIATLGWMMKNF